MTRFARIQRNKETGVKVPEDGTSWSEFKQQMTKKSVVHHKDENKTNISKRVNTDSYLSTASTSWCDFGQQDSIKFKQNSEKEKKSMKRKIIEDGKECGSDRNEEIPSQRRRKHERCQDVHVAQDNFVDNAEVPSKKNERGDNEQKCSKDSSVEQSPISKKERKYNKNDSKEEQINEKFDGAIPSCRNLSVLENNDVDNNKKEMQLNSGMSLIINGRNEKIIKFDGFYILETDADRIQQLRQKMIKNGQSREEIDGLVRRHRRNAEKYLTKLKKKLCFNCREGIHNLSECPKLGKANSSIPTGICYKCGSTEHSLFQCKVPGNDLKFARCFICNEVGHLSKQCPDNPRGLYPQGGSCRICGDVTHFKKDCPDLIKKKRDYTVTADIMGDSVDGLGEKEQFSNQKKVSNKKRVNKIVKFV